jgi:hypothetical protein
LVGVWESEVTSMQKSPLRDPSSAALGSVAPTRRRPPLITPGILVNQERKGGRKKRERIKTNKK